MVLGFGSPNERYILGRVIGAFVEEEGGDVESMEE